MKKLVGLFVAALFFLGLFIGTAGDVYAKEYKIGYVDLAKVFDDYKKTKDSEKTLNEQGKAKEAEMKKMIDELKKLRDEQALLSDKAKAEKQAAIDRKRMALQEFERSTRDQLVKERNDILAGIMKDIEKVVADYSKEKGYDIVMNSRMLLYSSQQDDLTAEVLSRLNK